MYALTRGGAFLGCQGSLAAATRRHASRAQAPARAPARVSATWDPEGVFGAPDTNLITRRELARRRLQDAEFAEEMKRNAVREKEKLEVGSGGWEGRRPMPQ